MMEFFARQYGKNYKPNTRETVRRQTVHQFLDAGLVIINPDNPARPINSTKAVYQIETSTLELLRSYGTREWEQNLGAYSASVETLRQKYAQERKAARIAVPIDQNPDLSLSPGGQNVLIEQIITAFRPRFTPQSQVLYIGDADEKFSVYEKDALTALGIEIAEHGKMPDVIIHDQSRNWLFLIEAVTSHGPVNPKRREELQRLFHASTAGLVFVTALLTRKAMVKYFNDLAWETEVWVAEASNHLIHFNDDKLLGPYNSSRTSDS